MNKKKGGKRKTQNPIIYLEPKNNIFRTIVILYYIADIYASYRAFMYYLLKHIHCMYCGMVYNIYIGNP